MTTQPFILDKWDIALIRLLKNPTFPTFDQMRELWAERNAVDINYIHLSYVVERMAEIVEGCNPRSMISLITNIHPARMWQYGSEGLTDHWEIWVVVLGHHLRMTEVVKLPGYREAVESNEKIPVSG